MAKINIKKVALLANLPITKEEEKLYQTQLEKILTYVDQIDEKVKDINVEPIFNVSSAKDITSDDQVSESLAQEEATKNASNPKDGHFVTKGVFSEE